MGLPRIFRDLIFVGLLGLIPPALASSVVPAEVYGDTNKLKLLLLMSETFKGFFSQAATYDVPLFSVLDQAEKFLMENPESFVSWNLQKRLTIHAKVEEEIETVQKYINPQALASFQDLLRRQVAQFPQLENQLKMALQKPFVTRSEGLTRFFLQTLPLEERKLFPKEPQKQVEFFRQRLTEASLENFDFKRFGLQQKISAKELVDHLESAQGTERQILSLLSLFLLVGPHHDIETRLAQFQAGDLDLLIEKENLKRTFEAIQDPWIRKALKPWAQSALARFSAEFTSQILEKKTLVSGNLILHEVHPLEALFRGFLAGDCSTRYSALYALSLKEKIFFIQDPSGAYRGTASMTLTEVQGRSNIYVHTISGPHISAAHTEIVLKALYDLRSQWGAETMTIPTPSRLGALNNFAAPKGVLEEWANKTSDVKQEYPDQELRQKIDQVNPNFKYDQAASNEEARFYQPTDQDLQVKTSFKLNLGKLTLSPKLDLSKSFLFTLEQHLLGHEVTAERISNITQLKVDHELTELIKNAEKLPLAIHKERLIRKLAQLNINVSKNTMQETPFIFGMGFLNAPDAFSEKFKDQSIEIMVKLLGKFPVFGNRHILNNVTIKSSHTPIGQILSRNLDQILPHPTFKKYYSSLFNADDPGYYTIDNLNRAGVPVSLAEEKLKENLLRLSSAIQNAISSEPKQEDMERVQNLTSKFVNLNIPEHEFAAQLVQLMKSGQSLNEIFDLIAELSFHKKRGFALDLEKAVYAHLFLMVESREAAIDILQHLEIRNIGQGSLWDIGFAFQDRLTALGVESEDIIDEKVKKIWQLKLDLENSRTAQEFILACDKVRYVHENLDINHRRILDKFADHFFSLKPTFEEALTLLSLQAKVNSRTQNLSLSQYVPRALALARQPDDWIRIGKISTYNEDFSLLDPYIEPTLKRFFKLQPTPEQLKSLAWHRFSPRITDKLAEMRIPNFQSIDEFIALGKEGKKAYSLVLSNLETFLRLLNSPSARAKFIRHFGGYFDETVSIYRILKQSRDPEKVLAAISWKGHFLANLKIERDEDFQTKSVAHFQMQEWAFNEMTRALARNFLDLNPSTGQIRRYIDLTRDVRARDLLFSRAASVARTSQELDSLYSRSKDRPRGDFDYYQQRDSGFNYIRLRNAGSANMCRRAHLW